MLQLVVTLLYSTEVLSVFVLRFLKPMRFFVSSSVATACPLPQISLVVFLVPQIWLLTKFNLARSQRAALLSVPTGHQTAVD